MNHGGIGRVTPKSLFISPDLLSPIFIDGGVSAFGMYYPPPDANMKWVPPAVTGCESVETNIYAESVQSGFSDSPAGHVSKHDIIVTPIPPEEWPFVVKLKMHIKLEPTCFQSVVELLKAKQINILFAETTRQNRIFSVLTMVVSLRGLLKASSFGSDPSNDVDALDGLAPMVLKERLVRHYEFLRKIVRKMVGRWSVKDNTDVLLDRGWLRDNLENILFLDIAQTFKTSSDERSIDRGVPGWPYPERAISVSMLSTLKYLHWRTHERILTRSEEAFLHRPFRVDCPRVGELAFSQRGASIVVACGLAAELPALASVEMDTREMTCRVSVIPANAMGQFREIKIEYTAAQTSIGLFGALLDALPSGVEVWRAINHVGRFKSPESGFVYILGRFLPDKGDHFGLSDTNIRSRVKEGLEDAFRGLQLTVGVAKLGGYRMFVSMRHREAFPRRDEFLGIIRRIAASFGFIDDGVHGGILLVEAHDGVPVQRVVSAIQNADCFLQVTFGLDLGGEGQGSAWLEAEAMGAAVLNIPMRVVGPNLAPNSSLRRVWSGNLVHNLEENQPTDKVMEVFESAIRALVAQVDGRRREGGR